VFRLPHVVAVAPAFATHEDREGAHDNRHPEHVPVWEGPRIVVTASTSAPTPSDWIVRT
jgi:hypothetical protein